MQSERGFPSAVPNVDFVDENFFSDYALPSNSNHENIERMLLNLALNHAVQVEKVQDSES